MALAVKHPRARLVSGGAKGVDQAAEEQALRCGLSVYSFRPRKRRDGRYEIVLVIRNHMGDDVQPCSDGKLYATYGQATYARNRKVVQHSHRVVAYTTGSRGTANALKIAGELGVPTHVRTAA